MRKADYYASVLQFALWCAIAAAGLAMCGVQTWRVWADGVLSGGIRVVVTAVFVLLAALLAGGCALVFRETRDARKAYKTNV